MIPVVPETSRLVHTESRTDTLSLLHTSRNTTSQQQTSTQYSSDLHPPASDKGLSHYNEHRTKRCINSSQSKKLRHINVNSHFNQHKAVPLLSSALQCSPSSRNIVQNNYRKN